MCSKQKSSGAARGQTEREEKAEKRRRTERRESKGNQSKTERRKGRGRGGRGGKTSKRKTGSGRGGQKQEGKKEDEESSLGPLQRTSKRILKAPQEQGEEGQSGSTQAKRPSKKNANYNANGRAAIRKLTLCAIPDHRILRTRGDVNAKKY